MASYSSFWLDYGGNDGAVYSLQNNKVSGRYKMAQLLSRVSMRETAARLIAALTDSVPASTASATISRVKAVADTTNNVQGGVRTIISHEQVGPLVDAATGANTSRAITAADITDLQLLMPGGSEALRSPSTYPVDASGNGGGGKAGNA